MANDQPLPLLGCSNDTELTMAVGWRNVSDRPVRIATTLGPASRTRSRSHVDR
jgi:hypothetical protein